MMVGNVNVRVIIYIVVYTFRPMKYQADLTLVTYQLVVQFMCSVTITRQALGPWVPWPTYTLHVV